jgi:PAP2 superfamily protein
MIRYFRRVAALSALLAQTALVHPASAGLEPLADAARWAAAAQADSAALPAASSAAPAALPDTAAAAPETAVPAPAVREGSERAARHKMVPLRDARQGIATLVGDSWYVITSPTRMHLHDALLTAGIATAALVAYAHDQEISDAFQRSQGQPLYDLIIKPGRAIEPVGNMGNTLAFYAGGLIVGYAVRFDPLRELTSEFIESHFISGGARNIAEVTIGRYRPFENKGPYYFKFQGGSSFPSGHASVVMELATILSHHAHNLPFSIAAYGAATTVCLERVDGKGHWPSDVIVGAATGHIIAKTVVRLHDQRRAARRAAEEEMGWRESWRPIGGWREGAPYLGVTARF